MEATVKIQKRGNDLGINIPPVIASELSLREGIYVKMHGSDNKIIIEPVKSSRSYILTDILSQITEDNIHQSVDTGMPIGNEIW